MDLTEKLSIPRSAPPAGNSAFTYLFNNYDVNYTKGSAEIVPVYSITVTTDGNGTASADKTTAYSGETVALTAVPRGGYRFKGWVAVSGNVTVIYSSGTFIMPDSDVTIKAVFEPVSRGGSDGGSTDTGGGGYITIEDLPPPLGALPNQNLPVTGGSSTYLIVISGTLMAVFGVFLQKKRKESDKE